MINKNYDSISAPSDKIRNYVGLGCAIVACLIFLVYMMIYRFADANNLQRVLDSFIVIFFVDIAIVATALTLSITQLVRNPFPSSMISVVLSGVVIVCLVVFLIAAHAHYGYTLF